MAIERGRGGVEVVADLSSNTEDDHSKTRRGGGWNDGVWESASEQEGEEEERSGRPPTGDCYFPTLFGWLAFSVRVSTATSR